MFSNPLMNLLEYAVLFIGTYVAMVFFLLFVKYYGKMPEKRQGKERDWTPCISVIVPAYNEAGHIKSCVQSLLDADYPKDRLEIIIVDDGSKDNTYEIANAITDSRVKAYTKPNTGKAASLNYGIERAKGELIAVLDADSQIEKETIVKMLLLFSDEKVAATTAAVKVRKSSNIIVEFQRIEYLFIIFVRRLVSFIDAVPVTPGPFSVYRAEILRKLGGFDEDNIVEDHEIALRLQSYNYRIKSSTDAEVYTEVPAKFGALMKQRVRWQKGGILNVISYRHMISPKYGDFGVFMLPLTIISIIIIFALAAITIASFFEHSFYADQLGLESFLIGVNPLGLIAIVLFIMSGVWAFTVMRSFKNENINPLVVLAYLVFYWFFSLAYNGLMVLKELKREKITW